ncbi:MULTISPECIES: carbon dioxide-concentrating mechanism protein [Pseudanabaena]|jgi:carbon dioxide concentrating mechanism protein CcmO|uniref:carbon dioxide-concentrating mechanism protein n=1 Tax=Pseudanabaena TaxID=1152 RepID=UPI00247A9595|nr:MULTISPECIES: BMC domain-containing protein [Pseudanabaena]MEA5486218.1 BMC domain-containing protein [Pseudanabaena sp. CCNP1317]WGS70591.1 BMC domain-containing protein [Pseudanabaena galeata CCNP1313]
MSSSASQRIDLSGSALGMVSTISFPAIVGTADMMLKSATVRLVGYEKVGNGFCTAIIRGSITDVRMAVEAGAETAREFGQLVSTIVIPRPYPNLEAILPISSRLSQLTDGQYSRLSNQAIGLLETRGFPAMVGAADMMLKSADVNLAGYETIGAGLCTAIIRGNVADVAIAIEAGMYEAERIGEFHTLMIIPRPLDDLEETLPTSEYWIETPIPVSIPMISLQEQERELVQLPNLEIAEVETISIGDL